MKRKMKPLIAGMLVMALFFAALPAVATTGTKNYRNIFVSYKVVVPKNENFNLYAQPKVGPIYYNICADIGYRVLSTQNGFYEVALGIDGLSAPSAKEQALAYIPVAEAKTKIERRKAIYYKEEAQMLVSDFIEDIGSDLTLYPGLYYLKPDGGKMAILLRGENGDERVGTRKGMIVDLKTEEKITLTNGSLGQNAARLADAAAIRAFIKEMPEGYSAPIKYESKTEPAFLEKDCFDIETIECQS